ncbi:MAG: nucleotidyltransferase family protein [Bacilli bacterium]|nr:nucleotidyltransferase family protein [Bacilli bacterium]
MEKEQFKQYIYSFIKLLSLYLNKKEDSSFAIDKSHLSFFYKMAKLHSLTAILYLAIKANKAQMEDGVLDKLEQYYLASVKKSLTFQKEREILFKYLNENRIDFLPLKGIVIKDYYLDPHSREFADNDILFDDVKSDLVKAFFANRHYEVELYKKSNHDVYLKKPVLNFEMHRALFGETGDNEKIVEYFKDYLNKAPIKNEYEHHLSNEDFYIYFTAHSYKHYHVSGCGIRTLIDYYLYLKKENLDFDYINKELEKLDLLDFSNQFKSVAIKVFDNEPLNEEEEEMLLFIASSGTYGTMEHSVDKGVKEKGKFGYFMARVFPPYRFYKSMYPWAYKCPILIPIAWLCRFFRILFKNPKRAANELKTIRKYKEEPKE